METPSEWAKRFNRDKAGEGATGSPNPEASMVESPKPVAEFPTEPFQCPACGQLLGSSCRVCVSCKRVINPAEIVQQPEAPAIAPPALIYKAGPAPVQFPWRIFFAAVGIFFLVVLVFGQVERIWGEQKAQWASWGVQSLVWMTSLWVFFDARRRRIPRPLRWGVGSLLLFIVVFPWYLSRRQFPESPVPFVEAKVGPVTRLLLVALIILFVLSAVSHLGVVPVPK